MKLQDGIVDTQNSIRKQAYEQAYAKLGVTEIDFIIDDPKNWNTVRQLVSDILKDKIVGRLTPVRPVRITPSREGQRVMRETPIQTYPYKCEKPTQKLKYLENKLKNKELTLEMFITFADAIGIKYSKKKYQEIELARLLE